MKGNEDDGRIKGGIVGSTSIISKTVAAIRPKERKRPLNIERIMTRLQLMVAISAVRQAAIRRGEPSRIDEDELLEKLAVGHS